MSKGRHVWSLRTQTLSQQRAWVYLTNTWECYWNFAQNTATISNTTCPQVTLPLAQPSLCTCVRTCASARGLPEIRFYITQINVRPGLEYEVRHFTFSSLATLPQELRVLDTVCWPHNRPIQSSWKLIRMKIKCSASLYWHRPNRPSTHIFKDSNMLTGLNLLWSFNVKVCISASKNLASPSTNRTATVR